MLDTWTTCSRRRAGERPKAQDFLVAPQGWSGAAALGLTRIDAPTPIVWITGRIKADGPADYVAVNKIHAELKVTPLSQWGKPATPVEVEIDQDIDMKPPPKIQVDAMEGKCFGTHLTAYAKAHLALFYLRSKLNAKTLSGDKRPVFRSNPFSVFDERTWQSGVKRLLQGLR